MNTVRWGIIGAGNVTEVKSGPALQKAERSDLVAVMRRSGDRARDYARRHHVPTWYDNAEALINDPNVDAVYIATPPHVHKQYTLMCAAAGKPVYVEKPMALNHAECQAMIEACSAAGVPLFVAYYRRALPRFLKIKTLIDKGAIGEVRMVRITLHQVSDSRLCDPDNRPWRVLPDIAGGGLFVDLGSHMLDFLDYVLGPISTVTGTASNQIACYDAEDLVTGSFMFESGVHGVGIWCFSCFDDKDETMIVGTHGQITYSCFDTTPIRLAKTGAVTEFNINNPVHVQQPLIQTVVDALTGAGACPSTGESAARTSWVMDQLLASYYHDR
ncbi:MAG: Gfo/Idh/MocA family oxidoreductase [Anaerolineae bacterium]|nr:Gfo/Idh/MocA family oxidoreductase [Anaerolineae bacterium]